MKNFDDIAAAPIQASGAYYDSSFALGVASKIGNDGGMSGLFKPVAQAMKWGQEVLFQFGLPLNFNGTRLGQIQPGFDGSKVTWFDSTANIGANFYNVAASKEVDGALEFEIVLGAPPQADTLSLPFQSQNLVFFEQRAAFFPKELTAVVADNIENSWAIYHDSKKDNQYQTGKLGHLMRFFALDAKGNKWWVTSTFNLQASTIDLVIGPEFATATYPVIIGPTLGYTGIGGTTGDESAFIMGGHFQIGANGTCVDFNKYVNTHGSPIAMTYGVYNSDGTTASGKSQVDVTAGGNVNISGGWSTQNLTRSGALVSGNWYWLGFECHATSNDTYFDSATGPWSYNGHTYGGDGVMDDPMITLNDSTNVRFSTYINYTTGGGPAFVNWPEMPRPERVVREILSY